MGYYDNVHNLPIIRVATVASIHRVPSKDKPYFLIDSRLQKGTSGSPVTTKPPNDSSFGLMSNPYYKTLVGVHSGEFDAGEPFLDLYRVFYASLIPEIIEGEKRGKVE